MLEQTYLKWLGKEVVAAKCALLVALEKKDSLLYIEEPKLKEEYMQKIGVYEEQVLRLELEVSLQEKKKQLIQTAINRREEIDLDAIEQQLEEERTNQLNRLNQVYKADEQQSEKLTEEEKEELQTLYSDIVREFHPEVRNDMLEIQKKLYQKALEAYKRQNIVELRLIHGMLFSSEAGEISIEVSLELSENGDEDIEELVIKGIAKRLMEDYKLAAELYSCFEKLEEDAALQNSKKQYEAKLELIMAEIDNILNRFPFVAKETMRNEDMLKEYIDSLSGRMNSAKLRIEELQKEIAVMIGD